VPGPRRPGWFGMPIGADERTPNARRGVCRHVESPAQSWSQPHRYSRTVRRCLRWARWTIYIRAKSRQTGV